MKTKAISRNDQPALSATAADSLITSFQSTKNNPLKPVSFRDRPIVIAGQVTTLNAWAAGQEERRHNA